MRYNRCVCDTHTVAVVVENPATCGEQAAVCGRTTRMSSNDSRPQKSDGTTTNGLSNRPPDDLAACRLSVADAIEQCPEERERARELLREAAQLLEADR